MFLESTSVLNKFCFGLNFVVSRLPPSRWVLGADLGFVSGPTKIIKRHVSDLFFYPKPEFKYDFSLADRTLRCLVVSRKYKVRVCFRV